MAPPRASFSPIWQKPPLYLQQWLRDRTSLTRRLQQLSRQQFSVTVLRQRWEKPQQQEAQALQIPPHEIALVREVILYGQHTPWVYARSVLPQRTLNGSLRFLRQLDNRPLGALLFSQRDIQRDKPIVQRYNKHCLPTALQTDNTPAWLWGRSSIFRHHQHGLLVSEVFLPALANMIKAHD
jgi:chorismate--pyruvate lyase